MIKEFLNGGTSKAAHFGTATGLIIRRSTFAFILVGAVVFWLQNN
tara:strand:- start:338 stop:472 length:135 start_codon:yes stop_codon:yes gene_type:complete